MPSNNPYKRFERIPTEIAPAKNSFAATLATVSSVKTAPVDREMIFLSYMIEMQLIDGETKGYGLTRFDET